MDSFKNFFKKLLEDRVILAKEDGEGGAPAGGGGDSGGVIAPGGDVGDSGVVSEPSEPHAPGLTSPDILGKCDHKKDGFFGPGCFHLPRCIWTIPCYRYPRKKKKRKDLKYVNLAEDDDYTLFEKYAKSVVKKEIASTQKWLDGMSQGLYLVYSEDYQFDDDKSEWVAALDDEGKDEVKEIRVAFNLPELFKFLYDQGLEMDETETVVQIRVSLWHEIGHALIQYFRDQEIYDFELSEVKEEELVEEFAKYMIKRYSGVTSSKLNDFIQEMFKNKEVQEESELDETKGLLLPTATFDKMIRLGNKRRLLMKQDPKSRDFVAKDIMIPGNPGLFFEQNGKDVTVNVNKDGLICLQVPIEPEDEGEQDFLELPLEKRQKFIDILRNFQKYVDDPQDEFEMDIASQFENASDQDRENVANRYSSLISGVKELWYSPTLIDVIRICHLGGIDSLPKDTLVKLDDRDHLRQRRFIESEGDKVDESYHDFDSMHDFVNDLFSRRSHFHKERWDFLKVDCADSDSLGKLSYVIKLKKSNGTGTNYIFQNDEPGNERAVLFGYDDKDSFLQTAYYIMPCEIVYMLRDGTAMRGNGNQVSVQLLWDCLKNIMTKKAFAGNDERLQKYL